LSRPHDNGAAGTPSDFITLRPGRVVGRYRIVSVLGQGGFGITYRAVDSELGRDVAIKEYLPAALAVRQDGTTVVPRSSSAAQDFAWGRDRFMDEGRILAALHRAPGIVLVHDFLEANGTAYLVMELLQGRTLHEQIAQQGALDATFIDKITWPLLDGLEQVHAMGFLHRDIKPANILIDGQGRPTLIDFGASRAAVAGRTQAMTAVFTPGYAAVEQFTAAAQGPWTDIYGLAATLHHAITGQPPPDAINRMLDDTYGPLADSNRPFPRSLLAGIDAGLAVRAAHRPQSIAAWRPILRGAAAFSFVAAAATVAMTGVPATASASSVTMVMPTVSPATSRRWPLLLAAGVALLCVLAGGWFVLGPQLASIVAPAPLSAPPPAVAALPAAEAPARPAPPAQDQAQAQLEEARRVQQAAVEEAARLRSEAEARRKSDEEAALRRKIEEEMRQKAEAEAASRRQADEDAKRQAAADAAAQAAAKRQAEEDAKARMEAETAARLKAEEADRKGAEAAEAALRLSQLDRQRLQVALTALGFATGGSDGVFGPRSREMIAAWQKKAGRAATGYLATDTQAALLRDAGPALARYDEEQRKLADARKDEQHPPLADQQASAVNGSLSCEGTHVAKWCRGAFQGFPSSCWNASATISNGAVSGSWTSTSATGALQSQAFNGRIDAGGNVQITYNGVGSQTNVDRPFTMVLAGKVGGGILNAGGRIGSAGRDFTVTIQCR
jgi:peptidoglycan hydrolase-like protein with peptidoglycan-binding domain